MKKFEPDECSFFRQQVTGFNRSTPLDFDELCVVLPDFINKKANRVLVLDGHTFAAVSSGISYLKNAKDEELYLKTYMDTFKEIEEVG